MLMLSYDVPMFCVDLPMFAALKLPSKAVKLIVNRPASVCRNSSFRFNSCRKTEESPGTLSDHLAKLRAYFEQEPTPIRKTLMYKGDA